MIDDRLAWEEHGLDGEQLDLFACQIDESAGFAEEDDREYQAPRKTQISELAGTTWEDAFGDAA